MSLEAAVKGIRTAIEAAKTAWDAVPGNYVLQIEHDNRTTVDLAALTTPYLMVDILWQDGQQMDLSTRPMTTDYGHIALAAGVKEGGGTLELIRLLDFVRPYLQLRDDIGVRTEVASLQKQVYQNGYCYQPMLILFWFTQVSTAPP